MVSPARRVVVVAIVGAVAALGAGGTASARKPPPLPPVNTGDACSYLTAGQVQKAFGGPVTVDPTNRNSKSPTDCGFLVGNPFTGGDLVSTNLFPGFDVPAGETALDVVESQRAIDASDGLNVVDVTVGKHSYIDLDRSVITVAATPKFAFSLQWLAPGAPAQGGAIDPPTRKQLIALAKSVVSRAPKR